MYALTIVYAVLIGMTGIIIAAIVRNQAFRRKIREETGMLLQTGSHAPSFQADEERLRQLPPQVAGWLRLTRSLEGKAMRSVTIRQEGTLRTTPEGRWMKFRATQHSLLEPPSFIWKANIAAAPGVTIYGRDLYTSGRADMLIKLMGIFTVGHARSREIDQGSLVRYLAEIVWYPPAALSPYIAWETVDHDAARAVISYGGIDASGIFYFHKNGTPVRFVAQRYKEAGGSCTLEEWSVHMAAYQEYQGILIPSQGEVSWNLKTGQFEWLRFEVKEAEFE